MRIGRRVWAVLASGVLCLGGCSTPGARQLSVERGSYIEALSQTNEQELLSNIVRLKYNDPPVFLNVEQIAASLSAEVALDATTAFGEGSPTTGIVGSGITIEQNPTIVYTPLSGQTFANKFLVPLNEAPVFLMLSNGFDFALVAELAFVSMNGLSNSRFVDDAERARFRRAAMLISDVLRRGEWALGTERVGADDQDRIRLVLQRRAGLAPSASADEVSQLLGLDPTAERIRLEVGLMRNSQTVSIETRSLLSIMSYLSNYVEAPSDHADAVWPGPVVAPEDAMIRIRSSSSRPGGVATTAVRHHDHWFYVGGDDIRGQNTLYLLRMLFNLQAQIDPEASRNFQLSLPVN